MRLSVAIKLRLYVIIGLSFFGFFGLAVLQIDSLAEPLQAQRQDELKHLGEVALTIAQGEYRSAEGCVVSDQVAQSVLRHKIDGLPVELAGAIARKDMASREILSNILAECELAVA